MGRGGLQVVLRDQSAIDRRDMGTTTSAGDGSFTIGPYEEDPHAGGAISPRIFGVVVLSAVGREFYNEPISDAAGTLNIGTVTIPSAAVQGFVVTGGSGAAARLTTGNAIRFLVDNVDAWGHFSDMVAKATSSVDYMQLEFDLHDYRPDIAQERPRMVMRFNPAKPIGPGVTRLVDPSDPLDVRPERLLLPRSGSPVEVRILMPVPVIDSHSLPLLLFLLLIPVVDIAIIYVLLFRKFDTEKDVADYYEDSGVHGVDVQAFPVSMFTRVHAKVCVVDDEQALLLGSPFIQGYYDAPTHAIDDPRRGEGVEFPIHDVSLAVRGPAVADLQQAFQLHWELVKPGTLTPATRGPAIPSVTPPEHLAAVQVIRTLPRSTFTSDPELDQSGETQCLEAYLRAIENAQQLIYLENQYFTNIAITNALIAALNDAARPNLQIILLINITPDIPFYPSWQKHRIEQILAEAGPGATRIEFFAAFTHEAPSGSHAKARIIPNYFHSKVGIVDDLWATVGSANLDGNSLDEAQVLHALQFGMLRNTEVNCAIYNGVDGLPATDAVDALRQTLWSEHLGIPVGDALSYTGSNAGHWLQLWRAAAERKRAALQANPSTQDVARILAFPHPGGTIPENPPTAEAPLLGSSMPIFAHDGEGFLINSGITTSDLEYVPKISSFDFAKGQFA